MFSTAHCTMPRTNCTTYCSIILHQQPPLTMAEPQYGSLAPTHWLAQCVLAQLAWAKSRTVVLSNLHFPSTVEISQSYLYHYLWCVRPSGVQNIELEKNVGHFRFIFNTAPCSPSTIILSLCTPKCASQGKRADFRNAKAAICICVCI